jgi:hypothetical protein
VALRGERSWRRRVPASGLGAALCAWCVAFGVVPAGASAARHFEKVSPADKGLGDIVGDGATTVASRFGDAVAFNSRTPFGDTVGSGTSGQTQYVARRSDEAWVVHAITPTPRPDARQTFFAPTLLQLYSEDLRAAIVRGYDLPAVTGDTPFRNNIYVEDTATRALEPITVSQVDPPAISDFLNYPVPTFWGISADARHVAFVTSTQFLPDAVPGVPNVYKWDDGVLGVASVLPDGNVAASGADTPANLRGAMSADGSRLLFTVTSADGNSQLYLQIHGGRTAWVSETELDPLDLNYQPDPTNVQVQGMTPDGRNVFFLTDTPLVPGDINGGTDLYRYSDDPSSDRHLTLISQDGDLAGGELVGMSDDGERVYYQTTAPRLAVWDHGTTGLVSATALFDPEEGFGLTASPGYARVSPDGMFVAFGTIATDVAGVHGLTGEVTNGHREMYLYSLRDRSLVCASCPPGSATADVTVLPAVTRGPVQLNNVGFRPRFLSDSGQVFFSTADALVSEDTNGVLDAYEFDPASGEVSLLSTGQGKDPATFADASASGDDVFIVTRQPLVASDRDDLVDLYDVRDGSSLPPGVEQQPPPPCEGDGCHPPSPASPSKGLLGSLFFEDHSAPTLLAVRQRLVVRGTRGLLPVRLFGAGRLTWSGRGLLAGEVRRSRGGTYRARLRLTRRARAQLRASGTFATSVHLTFVSAGGAEVERTTRVTFRVAAKKGR